MNSVELAAAYGSRHTPIEIPPTMRMLAAILDHVGTFFDEAGCPLSAEQSIALLEARDSALDRAAELQVER